MGKLLTSGSTLKAFQKFEHFNHCNIKTYNRLSQLLAKDVKMFERIMGQGIILTEGVLNIIASIKATFETVVENVFFKSATLWTIMSDGQYKREVDEFGEFAKRLKKASWVPEELKVWLKNISTIAVPDCVQVLALVNNFDPKNPELGFQFLILQSYLDGAGQRCQKEYIVIIKPHKEKETAITGNSLLAKLNQLRGDVKPALAQKETKE